MYWDHHFDMMVFSNIISFVLYCMCRCIINIAKYLYHILQQALQYDIILTQYILYMYVSVLSPILMLTHIQMLRIRCTVYSLM